MTTQPKPAVKKLESLAAQAIQLARTAKRNSKPLNGANFYATKLVELRADATNTFLEIQSESPGQVTALAETIEMTFAPSTKARDRIAAKNELVYTLRTLPGTKKTPAGTSEISAQLFPLDILSEAQRGYLVRIGREMNGCYEQGWYNAASVMMRRLLEICIIEAFEHKSLESKIKTGNGDYFQLTELINAALRESSFKLSRNTKNNLPRLRDSGHLAAHGRAYSATRNDIDRIADYARVVIEEFLILANLR